MKSFRSAFVAFLMVAAFLGVGHRAWFVREVVVSVGLESPVPVTCQIFYTDRADAAFSPDKAVDLPALPREVRSTISLPVSRLERLRFDFGTAPGTVRAGPVTVEGAETRTLDWRDFTVRHDIGRFDVEAGGVVDVESKGVDPYAVFHEPIGIGAKVRINAFAALCAVLMALLFWFPLAGPGGLLWNASPRDGEPICTKPFLLLVALLVIARFAVSAGLPPGFSQSPWDDLWFVNAADALLSGHWLGTYDQHTLIKGCFGPMVLAFSSFLGVPFLTAETFLYVLLCLFFLFVAARVSRNRVFLAASLVLLLFNPLSMAIGTFQRIHRNGMPLWQVPLVFGCFFLLYVDWHRSLRVLLGRAVAAGTALWMFQNTREDGIWIWPFVLACLAFSTVRAWKAGTTRRARAARALACLLPLAVFLAGNAAVCLVNWHFYGLPLRNDRDAGNYARAMRDLYLIEPDPADEARLTSPEHAGHYHSVYWSTICRAFEVSPTLQKARAEIEESFDIWAKGAGYHGRDLYEDKPLFALRHGAGVAGFYSSIPESEAFWKAVHDELSEAFEDGRLGRRGVAFTAMCAPFRARIVPCFLKEWKGAVAKIARVAGFSDAKAVPAHSEPWWKTMPWNDRLRSVSAEWFPDAAGAASARRRIERVNRIGSAYAIAFPYLLVAALAAFAVAPAFLFRNTDMYEKDRLLAAWLLAVGIASGFFLHTACIAYVSATTYWATIASYMASACQLELMFVIVVAGMFVAGVRKGDRP